MISEQAASARLTGRAQLDTDLFVSESQMDAWFYTSSGERLGPVAKEQLVELATSGVLNPRMDLCWTHGMEEWLPAGEIEGLFVKKRSEHDEGLESPDKLPRHPQKSSKLSESELELELLNAKWPGANRSVYLFTIWVLPVPAIIGFGFLVEMIFNSEDPKNENILASIYVVASLVLLGGLIYATLQRFKNLGMSGWWILGNFVPLINLWVGYRTICCPPGYDFHRKIDGIGIFLAILYWGQILLVLIMVAVLIAVMLGLGSGEMFEGLEQTLESWMEEINENGEAPQEE